MESRIRLDPGWILVILLTVFAIAPLAYPGFFQAQSGFLPVYNVEQIAKAPNWGRVADLLRGEGKLPYLLAWPFAAALGSGSPAIRCAYGLAFISGALGIYAWTRHWLGRRGAVLAAVVYTYLPWHLSTVYVRGAYAEAWLWAFWPLVLWAIDRWAARRSVLAAAVGLFAFVAALLTQPGISALIIPVLVAYGIVVGVRKPWPLGRVVAALGLVLLLLWIAGQVAPEGQGFPATSYLYLFQLFSAAGADGLSFQLGLAAIGLSIVAVALRFSGMTRRPAEAEEAPPGNPVSVDSPEDRTRFERAIACWLVTLLVLVQLSLSVAALLWRVTGFDAYLTAPWQVLALTGLPLAFLAGSVVRLDGRLAVLPSWAGLVALVVLASYPYLAPEFTQVDPGPEPVAMFQPVEASSPQIMLLDYQVAPPTEITPTLVLTLTWQAVQPVEADYTVFVHAMAGDGEKVAQRDSRPCDGECTTDSWRPGEIVLDRHQLELPAETPLALNRLALGLYLLDSGERAAVIGRDEGTVFLDLP